MNEMTSRTRPGDVPAHVVPGPDPLDTTALDEVVRGRRLYEPWVGEQRPQSAPERPTIARRLRDLESRVDAQDTHIAALHGVIDQLIEQNAALRHQLDLEPWSPQFRGHRP